MIAYNRTRILASRQAGSRGGGRKEYRTVALSSAHGRGGYRKPSLETDSRWPGRLPRPCYSRWGSADVGKQTRLLTSPCPLRKKDGGITGPIGCSVWTSGGLECCLRRQTWHVKLYRTAEVLAVALRTSQPHAAPMLSHYSNMSPLFLITPMRTYADVIILTDREISLASKTSRSSLSAKSTTPSHKTTHCPQSRPS
jgi:hypothetical protein